jgi:hypothetical protein
VTKEGFGEELISNIYITDNTNIICMIKNTGSVLNKGDLKDGRNISSRDFFDKATDVYNDHTHEINSSLSP